jgi:peptide/nickel transport system permease protein
MSLLVRVILSKTRYTVGALILLLFVFLAVFGPSLYPHGAPIDPTKLYAPPSWQHPLGTDFAGRDVLTEVVLGTRNVLSIAVMAGIITLGVGLIVGLAAGYLGGMVDMVLMRVIDFILSLPSYPLLIILATLLHVQGPIELGALLSLTAWAGLGRAIRAQVLSLKKAEYVEAARSLEYSSLRIAVSEVLPALMPYIVMHLITAIIQAVYGEVGLYLLGVVPVNSSNWGVMLNWAYTVSGAIYSPQSVLFLLAPLAAIVLVQMGGVLLNQALEEFFNPNLRTELVVRRRPQRPALGQLGLGARTESGVEGA